MLSEDPGEAMAQEYLKLWKEHGVEPKIRKLPRRPIEASARTLTTLEEVCEDLGNCQRCPLCEARSTIVFGTGNAHAKLVFVGEGPGTEEDKQGLPFVGRAGQLLDKIIEAMGYHRNDIYIANIVKCRPPQNRTPLPNEVAACTPFLVAQINLISPQVIVALGHTAASYLVQSQSPISALRGRLHPLHWKNETPVMPTYHPAYLLRNPSAKKMVWDDMKIVKGLLEKSL